MFEAKSTRAASYRVQQELIDRIDTMGWDMGKTPVLAVLTKSEQPDPKNCFVVLPWQTALHMLQKWDQELNAT